MKNHAMSTQPRRTSIRRTALSSLAVAVFTLVLGLAGQTPLQAKMCNCNVSTDCGAGVCRMGTGCLSPGQFIGLCSGAGGGGLKDLPDSYMAEPGPAGSMTKKRRQLQQP